jgi:2-oxoglutarate/2-oxoacid ferredoxin oxidoreductase subunit beta
MRRNIDLTYIVMDNQIYGLTTGQVSPTSTKGMKTKTTPHGSVENPINPLPLAMVGGATYVARAFSGNRSTWWKSSRAPFNTRASHSWMSSARA